MMEIARSVLNESLGDIEEARKIMKLLFPPEVVVVKEFKSMAIIRGAVPLAAL